MLDSRRYPSINRWDDLSVPASAVRGPGIADPGFNTDYCGWLYDGNATTETLLFNFQCKLSREPANAGDTYGADALMLFFDIHIKIDSLGSTYLYRKTYEAT